MIFMQDMVRMIMQDLDPRRLDCLAIAAAPLNFIIEVVEPLYSVLVFNSVKRGSLL